MLRLLVIEVIILVVQGVLYFGCETLQHDHRNVLRPIDDRIPLVPEFAYVYLNWFPLIAVYPLILYTVSAQDYAIYQLSIMVSIIASTVLYLLFPTRMDRHVPEDCHWNKLLRLIYKCDYKGSNCSPSLHCVQCFIIMMSVCQSSGIHTGDMVFIMILCTAIVASTVLIKQHALIDIITAVPLALFSFAAGRLISSHVGCEVILKAMGLA